MSQTVGDSLIGRLQQWGVRHVFGYPGDGINGIFGALNRANGKITFIQARHEEMAAFMASAYAKFSGRLGVCIATSGPGASHLTTDLYDALMDHQPVLAIVGQRRDYVFELAWRCPERATPPVDFLTALDSGIEIKSFELTTDNVR